MRRSSQLSRPWLLVPLSVLSATACVTHATEVIVVIDTNAPADRVVDLSASIGAGSSAMPMLRTWVRGASVPGSVALPASFAVVPAATDQSGTVSLGLHLHMEAGAHGEPPIDFDRTAHFRFTQHQSTVLRIYLPIECGAAARGCRSVADAQCTVALRCQDIGQTCSNAASCTLADVTPAGPDIDDGSVGTSVHPDIAPFDAPVVMDVPSADVPMPRDVTPTDVPIVPDACTGCLPGATRMSACGNCGHQTDTCSATCTWMAGTCVGSGACSPGATRMVSCGACASETDTCSASCAWVAGSCSGTCCAPHAGCAGGNPIGGVCAGNGDDGCGGACTCDAANGEACNVGSGWGTCCHQTGWYCGDSSQCCPPLTCDATHICR